MSADLFRTEVDLNVSDIILTPKICAQVTIHIFELLLFQRNQIPLIFNNFEFFASKWDMKTINLRGDLVDSKNKFEFQRQRYNAWKTFNEIKHYSNIIYGMFKMKKIIKSIRILIGSTPLMPKEIYIINIPNTCYDHYEKNHEQSGDIVKQMLKKILTSEILNKTFVNYLKPTNVYMDFELQSSEGFSNHLSLKDNFEYSYNSKQVFFNIKNNFQKKISLSCCQNSIFCDVKGSLESVNVNKKVSNNFNWYEINSVIRGFRGNKNYIWK